jgi:hypothetical protein
MQERLEQMNYNNTNILPIAADGALTGIIKIFDYSR